MSSPRDDMLPPASHAACCHCCEDLRAWKRGMIFLGALPAVREELRQLETEAPVDGAAVIRWLETGEGDPWPAEPPARPWRLTLFGNRLRWAWYVLRQPEPKRPHPTAAEDGPDA